MTTHSRSDKQTAISVSMTRELLEQVDVRAESLGLNRSQYLSRLAKNDLLDGGDLVLKEKASGSTGKDVEKPAGSRGTTDYPPFKRK